MDRIINTRLVELSVIKIGMDNMKTSLEGCKSWEKMSAEFKFGWIARKRIVKEKVVLYDSMSSY